MNWLITSGLLTCISFTSGYTSGGKRSSQGIRAMAGLLRLRPEPRKGESRPYGEYPYRSIVPSLAFTGGFSLRTTAASPAASPSSLSLLSRVQDRFALHAWGKGWHIPS
jgi:hypothetical protein